MQTVNMLIFGFFCRASISGKTAVMMSKFSLSLAEKGRHLKKVDKRHMPNK